MTTIGASYSGEATGAARIIVVDQLALRSIENGYGAYFVRAYDLMEDLRKARAEHGLERQWQTALFKCGKEILLHFRVITS